MGRWSSVVEGMAEWGSGAECLWTSCTLNVYADGLLLQAETAKCCVQDVLRYSSEASISQKKRTTSKVIHIPHGLLPGFLVTSPCSYDYYRPKRPNVLLLPCLTNFWWWSGALAKRWNLQSLLGWPCTSGESSVGLHRVCRSGFLEWQTE